ncbi:NepR family anti-sigma factor [Caulobacter sp. S45]|uniref:NepR family anti-sigma factor n=1 Tax=Caulobacter sp. S45 TaxID=1641861 RepID=UPI0015761A72|nr:NepR family anti-sigma factor [Caulobacter sp. S45]
MQPPAAQIPKESSAFLEQPLGDQLKTYFDSLTSGPVPDRLLRLTEALEAAFERGDLQCGGRPAPRK